MAAQNTVSAARRYRQSGAGGLAVNELLKARKLKQREIGSLLGVPQPKVAALKNYRLDQFSVERLMEFLTALNQDVEIMIRPRANTSETGHISVLAVP